ncbi:MAG: peptidase M48 [Sphingomonadales bacterium 32-68-7]|nr:MAG: peptidase M48 [Sphingomonadales bacterium 12-68-11]OYX08831.1 MAG: peptidase M48 [Sphingomonadales bacterium 32-68-7]
MPLLRLLFARLIAVVAVAGLIVQPAAAQSILRDAETEALLQDMLDPLVVAAGMPPGSVDVVLINDPSINAFVAGGQRIYIHSGLINAAETANEVQGVLAHELGHITGGHIISSYDGYGKAARIQLLSTLAAIAAMALGAGEAGMGLMGLGQQAAIGSFLSFSRTQESAADAAAVEYLTTAGISGQGVVSFFQKLQNQEYRYGYSQDDDAGFARTHPLTGDRISRLQADLEADPAWAQADLEATIGGTSPLSELQRRFVQVKAKLYGYLAKPADTLRVYPAQMTSVAARYARAYAYHKDARIADALAETQALIASEPGNPYFLELQGQVLLESGKPAEALPALREATALSGNEPLIAATFGHALIASEDPANLDEAERVLRTAVARDRENPFAWYQLGVVYASRGDLPRARLASAEQQIMSQRPMEALRNAEMAESALPNGSPDWLRAQDVAMQARAELEQARQRQ